MLTAPSATNDKCATPGSVDQALDRSENAVESAMADALRGAAAAGRWDVVDLLAEELKARR
jgi:hypothetical protein